MKHHSIGTRALALVLTLICFIGVLPTGAYAAAGTETIKLKKFGMSGVSYQSASLGRCTIHQMYYDYGGTTSVGFCGEKGKSMGQSLLGQTWGYQGDFSDPTVSLMLAYYYAHSTGVFTDAAVAAGVNTVWDAGYTWYMNAWVQAVVWRYKEGTLSDPVRACAEELMYVWNSLDGKHFTSIDQKLQGSSFRDRVQYIIDLGRRGVWGECRVKEYQFTGAGSSLHPAHSVQSVIIGELLPQKPQQTYSLVVRKTDATNPAMGLAGGRFHIASTKGSYSRDVVTGRDGTARLHGLKAGTYAVTEVEAPEGYHIDNAGPEYVVLPGNGQNTVTVTFADTPRISASGSIRKVDADDPAHGLAGAVIRIQGVDNSFTGTYTTGEGGALEVPWSDLPVGSYTAQEITPPEGYTLSRDPQKVRQAFHWDGKTPVSLVFENDAKVKVKLVKRDASDRPLPGAVFHIVRDGQIIGSEATNAQGEILVPNVTRGLYAFVEVSAPEGYACLQEPVLAFVDQDVVQGGGTVTVTAVDRMLPVLTIQKLDAQSKAPVPGTVFAVRGIHFGYHGEVKTDEQGRAVLKGLPVDSYEVTEKSVPEPYLLGENTVKTIFLAPGSHGELIFENYRKPGMVIKKLDAVSHAPVPGTVFTVTGIDSGYRQDWTTGEDGTVSLRLDPGSYRIREKSVPAPYYLPDDDHERVQEISLRPGDSRELVFKNHKMPTLNIRKVDSVGGAPVEGARFHVTYTSNGEAANAPETVDFGCFVTDARGEIRLHETGKRLYPGEYTVTEVKAAPGFQLAEPLTQKVILHGSEQKTLRFENVPLNAIIVEKYDSVTHKPLAGATFQLRYLGGTSGTGGTVIGQKVTGDQGTAIWTGLKSGTYVVEEVAPADGYHILQSSETVYLHNGGTQSVITVRFGNMPDGSLLIRKVCAVNPAITLQNAEFKVTYADGTVVGTSNGMYRTDENGEIRIGGLIPGKSVVVTETQAPKGYILDTQSQTIEIQGGKVNILTFKNQPKGELIIQKRDSVTNAPLPGAEFRITTAAGCEVGLDGVIGEATLTQNGIFTTDAQGEIHLSGLRPGAYVITEIKAPAGYQIDTPGTNVVIGSGGDAQTVVIKNTPLGGLQIIKVDADTGERIAGVEFEIRKMNGEIIGTYTTDRQGVIALPKAQSGWYTVTETKAADGYDLDAAPAKVCVKNGETATLRITNKRMCSIMIHKVDADTGKGIYGVKFLLYDAGKNPIGEYETDQDGYIYIRNELKAGKYFLRELEAGPGYIRDEQYKTIYVERGKCTQIEWENSAITGQIQIRKYAQNDNPVTGQKAGDALEGAVFEITRARSGAVVGYIVTDKRGVAASSPLPLGRYFITEVSAPAYYQRTGEQMEAEIEYPNQIIKLSAYNKAVDLGVTIKKVGNREIQPGQVMRYSFSNIRNASNVALNHFFWHDRIPTDATRAVSLTTGTYNQRLYYKVLFKTNMNDYRVLAGNLLTSSNYSLSLSAGALGLLPGECVTDVRFDFGTVAPGFASSVKPLMFVQVLGTVGNGYQIVNRADVGGKYLNEWQTARAPWVTVVRRFHWPSLPQTGY